MSHLSCSWMILPWGQESLNLVMCLFLTLLNHLAWKSSKMNVVSTRRPFTSRHSRLTLLPRMIVSVFNKRTSLLLYLCVTISRYLMKESQLVFWPCRMESFVSTFHCEEASTDPRQAIKVIVDGCHNGASVDLMTDLRQRNLRWRSFVSRTISTARSQ